MKTKLLSIAVLITAGLSAQVMTERPLEPFSKIEVTGAAKVYYTTSDTLSLKIAGDQKEAENVETKVEKGILFINVKGKSEDGISVYVGNNRLNGIMCAGASQFKTVNTLKADTLTISAAGASHINAKIECQQLTAGSSGASNMHLSGNTSNMDVVLSGASVLKSYDLVSKSVNITASGASSGKVYVTTKLVAKASGASSIKVKGEVSDIDAESTSAASITRIMGSGESTLKDSNDSTTIRWKGNKVIIIGSDKEKKKSFSVNTDFDHWAGFALGVNGLLTPDATTSMPGVYKYMDLNYSRSINVQLNLFQKNFHIYKNYVNVVTGLGFEWRRYMLENKTTLQPDSSFTWGTIDSTNTFKYSKNLFKSTMLQVPLLLEFNTHRKASKSFHIAMGVVGQFMINSKTKQILERNGDEFTKINRDSYNMTPWNLKAHASIGYSAFTVFAEYNITPLFEKGEGPQLYPFVAGVRIVPF